MTIHELWKCVEICTFLLIIYKHIVLPYITDGPGSSVSLNPADQSITKILGQGVGPIVCSAQCNPRCQFHWLRPGGTVINGSNLTIPSLSKNDHGTFTCHTGNDYGNNATKNLNVTVNCKCIFMIIYFELNLTKTNFTSLWHEDRIMIWLTNEWRCGKENTAYCLRYICLLHACSSLIHGITLINVQKDIEYFNIWRLIS